MEMSKEERRTYLGIMRRRRRSSLDGHRREIPLKVDVWPEPCPKEPGYVEVDTLPGWPVEAGFVLRTPGEAEPEWMRFMKKQEQGGAAVLPDSGEAAPGGLPVGGGVAGAVEVGNG